MLLARFSISEPFELVIIRWSTIATRQRWSAITVKFSDHEAQDRKNLGCHRVIVFWHWSSFFSCSSMLFLSFLSSAVISLSVFHPFSKQSDRVCPTGQPFSTHHAHHFLSSFPLVCFFHLLWPVHLPSTTPHKPFHLCVCVPQCVAYRSRCSTCISKDANYCM